MKTRNLNLRLLHNGDTVVAELSDPATETVTSTQSPTDLVRLIWEQSDALRPAQSTRLGELLTSHRSSLEQERASA
ncbi:MAG TPA: hypothetical protein VFB58_14245 [Chloroflexota bacterium]|nr:hypothetical protein [Chloroflexota bacterium]